MNNEHEQDQEQEQDQEHEQDIAFNLVANSSLG